MDMNELGLNGYPRQRHEAIALARIAALQSTLGWIAPMSTRPVFISGPVEALPKAPRKAKGAKVAKPVMLTGEQFYDQWMAAIRRMREVQGEHWHLRPHAWQWCTLLPKHRKFTTAIVDDGQGGKRGGVTLKWAKDQKLPAARYWAASCLLAWWWLNRYRRR